MEGEEGGDTAVVGYVHEVQVVAPVMRNRKLGLVVHGILREES